MAVSCLNLKLEPFSIISPSWVPVLGGGQEEGRFLGEPEEKMRTEAADSRPKLHGSLTRGHPHFLRPCKEPLRNPAAPRHRPRSRRGALALTSLLRDGAVVSVAGQGGCGPLVQGAARGRPAARQALHGPGLHAAPAAGRALREQQAWQSPGLLASRCPPHTHSPPSHPPRQPPPQTHSPTHTPTSKSPLHPDSSRWSLSTTAGGWPDSGLIPGVVRGKQCPKAWNVLESPMA